MEREATRERCAVWKEKAEPMAHRHDDEGDPVDLLPAELVTEVAKENLPNKGPNESGASQNALVRAGHDIVWVVKELDYRDQEAHDEEVIAVSEEANPRDEDGGDVKALLLGVVQHVEHGSLDLSSGDNIELPSTRGRSHLSAGGDFIVGV
jgi:hypothetical protein